MLASIGQWMIPYALALLGIMFTDRYNKKIKIGFLSLFLAIIIAFFAFKYIGLLWILVFHFFAFVWLKLKVLLAKKAIALAIAAAGFFAHVAVVLHPVFVLFFWIYMASIFLVTAKDVYKGIILLLQKALCWIRDKADVSYQRNTSPFSRGMTLLMECTAACGVAVIAFWKVLNSATLGMNSILQFLCFAALTALFVVRLYVRYRIETDPQNRYTGEGLEIGL